jgi:hypothetical protein
MHTTNPDPYEVLGIAPDATQREVKQAYRGLAMKFHPDHNPDDRDAAERFKQIQLAYETLTGCKNPGSISPASIYRKNYPPWFFTDEHPFFSFFRAIKAYGAGIKKDKNLSDLSNLERTNDAIE